MWSEKKNWIEVTLGNGQRYVDQEMAFEQCIGSWLVRGNPEQAKQYLNLNIAQFMQIHGLTRLVLQMLARFQKGHNATSYLELVVILPPKSSDGMTITGWQPLYIFSTAYRDERTLDTGVQGAFQDDWIWIMWVHIPYTM